MKTIARKAIAALVEGFCDAAGRAIAERLIEKKEARGESQTEETEE